MVIKILWCSGSILLLIINKNNVNNNDNSYELVTKIYLILIIKFYSIRNWFFRL